MVKGPMDPYPPWIQILLLFMPNVLSPCLVPLSSKFPRLLKETLGQAAHANSEQLTRHVTLLGSRCIDREDAGIPGRRVSCPESAAGLGVRLVTSPVAPLRDGPL